MGRGGKVDIRELKKFRDELEQNLSGQALEKFIESCAKELAARLLAKVIHMTPVGHKPEFQGEKDEEFVKVKGVRGRTRTFYTAKAAQFHSYWIGYQGGTLRRGWTAGQDMKAEDYAKTLKIAKSGEAYTIEIVNPVEYASYVEFGHRQTPGRYVPALGVRLKNGFVKGKKMLTISEDEIRRDAPRVLENKLKQKLGEYFK